MEAEEGVHAAVVQEAEAAYLRALVAVVAGVQERDRRHAEHADLLVGVAQVGDLEQLGLELEAREPIGAEEAVGGVEVVASIAVLEHVGVLRREELVVPGLLVGGHAVVEVRGSDSADTSPGG